MKVLIDSRTLMWGYFDPNRLSSTVKPSYPSESFATPHLQSLHDFATIELPSGGRRMFASQASTQSLLNRVRGDLNSGNFSRIEDYLAAEQSGNGTRLDMRSASRVGKSDLGVNARRIGGLLQQLDGVLAPSE